MSTKKVKSPWIPPGRSRQRDRIVKKHRNTSAEARNLQDDDACIIINENDGTTRIKFRKDFVRFNLGLQETENTENVISNELPETTGVSNFVKSLGNDNNMEVTSLCSDFDHIEASKEKKAHLNSIKQEMKLLTIHFMSLKQTSQFLNGFINKFSIQDTSLKDLLQTIDDEVKKFIFKFDDLEYSVTLVENTLPDDSKVEEYIKALKLKDDLLSRLLDSYSKAFIVSQTLLQVHDVHQLSYKENESLQRQLEEKEKAYFSQENVVQDLKKKLAIFQGRTNTLESYKSTLENNKTELQKQLAYKEAQIQILQSELSKVPAPKQVEDEKLLEVIEGMKNKASAEKVALKKALKAQKVTLEKIKQSNEKLQTVMEVKSSNMSELAAQRDELKLKLTVANNTIIDCKNKLAEIQSQNLKLQDQTIDKESDFKKELQQLSDSLERKSTELENLLSEKSQLQQSLEESKRSIRKQESEMQKLEMKLDKSVSDSREKGDSERTTEGMNRLISLVEDTNTGLKSLEGIWKNPISGSSGDNTNEQNQSPGSIFDAILEIKDQLTELKLSQNAKPTYASKEMVEGKVLELQSLLYACVRQKDALAAEVKRLKRQNHSSHINENENSLSTHVAENDYTVQNLQVELRLKSDENDRLKQKERDLERQLEEVKDKLQKKEIENVRYFSIEEELRTKKNELSVLEKLKEEESDRLLKRIKELQETLDNTATECESLKRYVTVLRTSYSNVFGNA